MIHYHILIETNKNQNEEERAKNEGVCESEFYLLNGLKRFLIK